MDGWVDDGQDGEANEYDHYWALYSIGNYYGTYQMEFNLHPRTRRVEKASQARDMARKICSRVMKGHVATIFSCSISRHV